MSAKKTSGQLTLWSEEALVRVSATPDAVRGWLTSDLACSERWHESLMRSLPAGWSGRTCPVASPAKRARTSPPSSGPSAGTGPPCPEAGGSTAASASDPSEPAPGLCWTVSTSDWRSGASACSLSAVLETQEDWLSRNPDASPADFAAYLGRYCLSARACRGILRRAEKRGRELPPALRESLEARAMTGPDTMPAPAGMATADDLMSSIAESFGETWEAPAAEMVADEEE